MRVLDFPLSLKSLDSAGTFEGLASVYNVKDLHNEIVAPGAFAKTIAERPTVKLLYQHDPNEPIGTGAISDSPAGLIIRGRLALGVTRAREAYELLKAGVLDSLSIGYDVIKDRRLKDGTRLLSEIRLWEVSIVTFPANPAAVIGSVKRDVNLAEFRRQLASLSEHIAKSNAEAATRAVRHEKQGGAVDAAEVAKFRRLVGDMRAEIARSEALATIRRARVVASK